MAVIRKKAPENNKSELSELLSELINKNTVKASTSHEENRNDNPHNWVDIIEFCDSPYYLGFDYLYPWQKLILKLFYMGSAGNKHLEICEKESGCRNCGWFKNNLRGSSPCLKCTAYSKIDFQKDIKEVDDKMWLTPSEIEELKKTEKVNMFLNEKMLIEQDLIEDSDATNGGSVKRQVLSKVRKAFSELLLVLGRRASKQISLDTPIITLDGWKTMRDIHPGDYVFGPDGFPTKVIAESEIDYAPDCYEITFSNGEKILADSNHEWSVIDYKGRAAFHRSYQPKIPRTIGTKILNTGEIYKKQKYIRNDGKKCTNYAILKIKPLQYEEKELSINPYLLGYFLGDGDSRGYRVTTLDIEPIIEFAKEYTVKKQDKYHSLIGKDVNNIAFVTKWKKLNLFKNKHIPKEYLISGIQDRLELIQGLMDSDGSVNGKGSCRFVNKNLNIILGLQELLYSFGIESFISQQENIYTLSFTPNFNINIFKIERKQNILNSALKNKHKNNKRNYIFIEKVEKHDPVPMKCIQVDNESHQYLCGKTMIPTHNSFLVSIIGLYESYKLIEMGNPQAVFGNLSEGDTICILNVAVSEQQAKESIFDKIKAMIMNSPYFKKKISPGSIQNRSVRFLTPRDEEMNKQLISEGLPARDGSIYLLSGHSNSDSLVGKNVIVVIIDEMASMVGKDGSKMSDEELYTKLKNSIWTFGRSGKIICISNPLTKDGKFYELYEQSFTDDRMLMIQLPSYKVNPTLDQKVLDEEREAARKSGQHEQYLMQIEARFSGGASDPFIPSEFIDYAFEKGNSRRRAECGDPKMLYYMHLDPANNSDNYALAIVHVEEDPYNLDDDRKPRKLVIVDHINMWQPSETGEPVNISDVDQYVIRMCRHFNIVSITYDMWESAASSQLLQRMGLPARVTHFNSTYKQQVYATLRNVFYEQRIEFYKLDGYDSTKMLDTYGFVPETMDQFKFLGRKFNRQSFSVMAASGHNDDIPDCVAGASYVALTGGHGYTSLPKMGLVRMSAFR